MRRGRRRGFRGSVAPAPRARRERRAVEESSDSKIAVRELIRVSLEYRRAASGAFAQKTFFHTDLRQRASARVVKRIYYLIGLSAGWV
jgi:hypothetical protein